jgi:hypothetical protein
LLKNVRLSYPKLFAAEHFDPSQPNSEPRYSASFLISKEDKTTLEDINAAVLAVAKEKFADKAQTMLKSFKANPQKFCLKDGDEVVTKKGDLIAPGYFVIAAHRREAEGAPTLIDRSRAPLTKESGKLYAGCFVNASIDLWAQDGTYSGVRCTLLGVQFAKDGDSFGGSRPASPDEFEVLDTDEDDAFGAN